MINKTSLKFVAGFVAIIGMALASLYFFQAYFSPEKQAERKLADLERQQAEDMYGGKTPAETLQLFVDALKADDIDLASKYFVVESRNGVKKDLSNIEAANKIDVVMARVAALKQSKVETDSAVFMSTASDGSVDFRATLERNPQGVWKITAM